MSTKTPETVIYQISDRRVVDLRVVGQRIQLRYNSLGMPRHEQTTFERSCLPAPPPGTAWYHEGDHVWVLRRYLEPMKFRCLAPYMGWVREILSAFKR